MFMEKSWQGIGSVAQIPGLFHILLDYLITYTENAVWESPFVSNQAKRTQK